MRFLAVITIFTAMSLAGVGIADADQWFVIKDKAGECSPMRSKPGSPVVLSGPYASKEEAEKALKAANCKPSEKTTDEKKTDK